MHYLAYVLIPASSTDTETAVIEAMAPYEEATDVDDFAGYWDWWQVGGRWTGILADYTPQLDPDNIETCWLCHGTGIRNDELGRNFRARNPGYTCNGCDGKGAKAKWPTEWKPFSGDRVPVSAMAGKRVPHDVVAPDGWHARETWSAAVSDFLVDEAWGVVTYPEILARYPDHDAVVVDYHS